MKKFWKITAIVLCLGMVLSLCACGGKGGQGGDSQKTVNLVWYLRSNEPKGFAEVQQAINEYTTEKLGATVEIRFIQPGDWKEKVNMMMAAKEEFDLIYTGDWATSFSAQVNMGGLMPLNDLLEEVPTLKGMFSEGIWDATSFDGKIYGVPNTQVLYNQAGLWFKKDIVEKYGFDLSTVSSLDDLTPMFETVKAGEAADFIPTRKGLVGQFDTQHGTVEGFPIIDGKVTDLAEERLPQYKIMREWYEKGFFPADVATMTDDTAIINGGKVFSCYARYLPGVASKFNLTRPYEIEVIPTNDPLITRASVQSAMTSISATSKNPEKAIQLIELMETDQYLLNLLCYGIEGRDYEKDPDNENRINRSSDSYYVAEFLVGNQLLAYLQPSYEDTVWEETDAENKAAPVDPNNGFSFNQDPVKTELTNLNSVSNEFTNVLSNGLDDPEATFQKQQEKRELAGLQKVMEEIQNQYDAWLAQQ